MKTDKHIKIFALYIGMVFISLFLFSCVDTNYEFTEIGNLPDPRNKINGVGYNASYSSAMNTVAGEWWIDSLDRKFVSFSRDSSAHYMIGNYVVDSVQWILTIKDGAPEILVDGPFPVYGKYYVYKDKMYFSTIQKILPVKNMIKS